ncbi:MAG: alpha/beta hydrolase fold family protein [Candidatus Xenolissoclinum pacificiensis L6]|uniref:Alpha/beta hydrolase fold family protein n=1 Tax=Candidatus Xenolissoclinum pacificiensis L6 TaxID=1401685 RepID=W2UY80_9RICK|nr:MAG: alpha/beta hydrolase fold family protein [Candidatus Xenolissoclinum pacificiensis L6]
MADQYYNALNPDNYFYTNCDVISKAIETQGQSIAQGMKNFVRDAEIGRVQTVNTEAFTIGQDIAGTAGDVIFENHLFQLIAYQPVHTKNYSHPLLFIPPWINKFYILDLQTKNSMVKYCVDDGYTVFMISWVNPSEDSQECSFEDYMTDGVLQAIEFIYKTFAHKVNVVGYCISSTLLAISLAYCKAKGIDYVNSATCFACTVDFSDAGQLRQLTNEKTLPIIEQLYSNSKIIKGSEMYNCFAFLKSDSAIWGQGVKNYLKGEDLPVFDILYWNNDNTNLFVKAHMYFLREIFVKNILMQKKFSFANTEIPLTDVEVPMCFVSAEQDHIIPWVASYRTISHFQNSQDRKFILCGSGHVAGIINAPEKNKYYYYVDNDIKSSADDNFFEGRERVNGSWWNEWKSWLKKHSGNKIDIQYGERVKPLSIEPAPGRYVMTKSD